VDGKSTVRGEELLVQQRRNAVEVQMAISFTALLVAVVSFVLTYLLNRQGAVTSKQPIIVFEFDPQVGWRIRNIGKGPALNLVVSVRGKESKWSYPVSVPSLRDGTDFTLAWIGMLNTWMLGATYSDFEGRPYTTISQHDGVKIEPGHVLSNYEEPYKDYLPGSAAPRFWNAKQLTDDNLT
jgi:hypothetical protein